MKPITIISLLILSVSLRDTNGINAESSINNSPRFISWCYGEHGCFTALPPFGGTPQRPIGFLPQPPPTVGTRFLLYTRERPVATEIGRKKKNLGIGTWKAQRMTRFVIHGLLENYQTSWYTDMRRAFLDNEDSNIIFVDWSKSNKFPYTQATANTQMVGAEVALFIKELASLHGANLQLMHIIGHSLGAHAAGYAGERISPRIGRITGLDPAGPYFEYTVPEVRLDPSDAQFVDVIHTDGQAHLQLGLGLIQPIGHADFFPNGGLEQPKCPQMGGKIWNAIINLFDSDAFSESVLCSHLFSVYTFTDSIRNSNCAYVSVNCSSMDKLRNTNECTRNQVNYMGLKALPDRHGNFYLPTQDANAYPYCQHLYSVTLSVGNTRVQTISPIEISFPGLTNSVVFDAQSSLLLNANTDVTRTIGFNQPLTTVNTVSINLRGLVTQTTQPIKEITIVDIEKQNKYVFCSSNDGTLQFNLC